MDFRNVDVSRVHIIATKAHYGATKLVFQTPRTHFSFKKTDVGMSLVLERLPRECADFFEAVDARIASTVNLPVPMHDYMSVDRCLFVRLYDDTLLFDERGGEMDADKMPARGVCQCLVELKGIWTNAAKWGPKFVVRELKLQNHVPGCSPLGK